MRWPANRFLVSASARTTAEHVAVLEGLARSLLLRAEARDDARAQYGGERPRGWPRPGGGRRLGAPSPACWGGGGGEGKLGGGNAHCQAATRASDKATAECGHCCSLSLSDASKESKLQIF